MALTIQERLKDLRVERGLTLEQLAEQTHLSKSALGSYEADEYKDISHYVLIKLAKFYGVTADYLLGLTETKKSLTTEYSESTPAKGTGGKRNPLSKKSGGILCKGNRLEAYRLIDQYQGEFGTRWLLRRLDICSNAYYNYRKHRKADYYAQKNEVQEQIREIYHEHNGVDGYRSMTVTLPAISQSELCKRHWILSRPSKGSGFCTVIRGHRTHQKLLWNSVCP